MIKAVIFDFFGVLVTEGVTTFNKDFFAGDKIKLKQVDALVDELNMAKLPYSDFVRQLSKISGVDEDKVRGYLDVNHANSELLNYIRDKLKPQYKIGIISNAGGNYVEEMIGKDNARLFDNIVLSHSVGVAKPEPTIYEVSLRNLDVRAEEAVFIDDIQRYCEAAQGLGMKTIVYQDFGQMKTELEKILSSADD